MQRAAERDQRSQRAKGRGRVLVCAAAVPVVLLVAGCSSDSGSGDKSADKGSSGGDTAASAGASASPTVQAAAYAKLPDSCGVLSKKTLTSLVPKGVKSAKKGASSDAGTRASCSWNSLDNNGVKGSQFRWLNVSLLRFESDAARGEGNQLAHEYFTKQVKDAQAVEGAKNTKWQTVAGTGDEATLVHYDLKKKEGSFKQQTVVARVENVVVTVDYNGAGLAGEKTPDAKALAKLAEQAAKEAVATVSAANGDGGAGSGTGAGTASPSPSKSASKSPSASASPSKAAKSASASPSSSASKKS
ncbi:DUF3558 family protein [Streptomyces sp. MBT33]|uniref:DUF3558 family protein n=1 Tax=Streptomyces sp. MBT33 TaxID=1488363 RepID=UPI001F33F307|nr:DUF3558 family protein [Streptomyces sp. MBT33]